VAVLLIDRYRQYEINRLVQLTGATGWIVPAVYKKTDYGPIVRDVLKDHPDLRHVVIVRSREDPSPFSSLEGMIEGAEGFLGSVVTMGKVVFLDSTDNQDICEAIQRERVTSIVWVPTLAKRLVQYEHLDRYDLSSLKKMHSAGGASHPDLVKQVIERLGMTFLNAYGATEGMTAITRPEDDLETVCSTVGRPTCPYDTYKVIDPDGNELPPGEQGELVLKGPGVFTGYYNNPEENKKAFTAEGRASAQPRSKSLSTAIPTWPP
jgi:non-ribosomal peptide synthetase component E (peptide arylation enzyme)